VVERASLIGMNAAILNNARIGGDYCGARRSAQSRIEASQKIRPGELSNITARSFYPEFLLSLV
jgi:carbonic anhydrase/acetyltransferase-like protein (isoleucine patch superfamily)